MDKMGPFEAIGRITVGLSGLILGYCVAGEAVEYAKSIVQQPDAISYMITQHPTLTKVVGAVGIGSIFSGIGSFGGLIDVAFGLDPKN
ncbi:MAG: hypothetical protein KJ939_06755 [Nanoarchaeota archaeon]|nr:hypothetical protein [Nanoarchaeota archaeon]MBU4352745.1 hypothetical protein [Nanoarchaeota archaeon]MCG2719272.1 hypothetical protein [Nanoarchaeota archaeon]